MHTETIDKLFLELAQISTAITPKRIALRRAMAKAVNLLDGLVPTKGQLTYEAKHILQKALVQDDA